MVRTELTVSQRSACTPKNGKQSLEEILVNSHSQTTIYDSPKVEAAQVSVDRYMDQ